MNRNRQARPVVFGEALMDVFPDGTEVLGGAPFNVAWHLAAFGLEPLFVSAVGDDKRGRAILARMDAWKMDTAGVQIDPAHPTGEVRVTIERDEPYYEILADRAYDFIDSRAVRGALRHVKPVLVVHGSLAVRNETSARALRSLLAETGAPAFLDVNLRPPWDDPSRVSELLDVARWVKLNAQELRVITGGDGDDEALACGMMEEHGLSEVVLTRSAAGAVSIRDGAEPVARAATDPPETFVDAVGAGDAFTAVIIVGFLLEWPPALRMERAVRFASSLCGLRGAVTTDRGWYGRFIAEWGM